MSFAVAARSNSTTCRNSRLILLISGNFMPSTAACSDRS